MTTDPQTDCPNCQHDQHLPGTDCDAVIEHGPKRWHRCLCLARPGAALPCPPQMTCQGGTLGYADIWYLQHGHTLASADGEISPEVLSQTGVMSVGFPSGAPGLAAAVPVAAPPTTEQAGLRDRIRRALCEASGNGFMWDSDMLEPDEYGEAADMVLAALFGPIPAGTDVATWTAIRAIQLMNEAGQQRDEARAVLPAPADRAATLREAATRYEEILANADTGQDPRYWTAVRDVTLGLRAMAVEAGQASEDQPETPLEKRLRYSERRNDELRTECLRRGKTVLEQAEKIVALERQIDEVRSQLGAEILRAGQAEAELRRVADAERAGGPSREATEPQPAHRCGNCEGIDPDSCLTNLDRPAVKAQQAAAKTPDEAPGRWCKCRSCWGWFVEDHPGEDLDELGRDLGWWSGLPEHRAAPAGVGAPETVHACPPDGSSRPGTEQEA